MGKPDLIISARVTKAPLSTGAIMVPCRDCGAMCWASPRSQGEMQKNPDLPLICVECAEAMHLKLHIN